MTVHVRRTIPLAARLLLAASLGFGGSAAWAAKSRTAEVRTAVVRTAVVRSARKGLTLRRLYDASARKLDEGPLLKTSAGTQHLDSKHYESVRDAALAMMKKYPPASHYYLSLGRSPVSIHAFLKALSADITTTFPASDLRLGITPENHPAYYKHFEHFIPAEVLKGKRGDIVIFDRSHDRSGSSLALIKPLLEQYLAKKGYKTKVIALGFAGAGPLMAGVQYMSTRSFPKVFLYFNGADHDEAVAPYVGHHTIGTHGVRQITQNPAFRRFTAAMEKRMAADAELDELLRTESHLTRLASAE